MKNSVSFLSVVLGIFCTVTHSNAQSTSWSYQGNLTTGGSGADGLFDMTFGLFTSDIGGTAVSTVTNTSVSVSNGLFTATLDFGAAVFDGTDYWLEIGVQPDGGAGFTALGPRQSLTATPYAINARTAATAAAVSTNAGPVAGAVRWTGSDFEGYNGFGWVSLTGRRSFQAGANMVFIPPGTFIMGSPDDEVGRLTDEGPQTTVTISQGFWMGKYEVTQQEYQSVIGSNPSGITGGLERPVEAVNWDDSTNYCAVLTSQERAAGRIPPDYEYRLPTEAEWEYACRAGTTNRFSYGDDDPNYRLLTDYGWYNLNSGSTTHAVGGKHPNPWGLYDMHGNMSEWCQDWYDSSYPGGAVTDPTGPATGTFRVYRSGGWGSTDANCRTSRRIKRGPSSSGVNFVGLRVVLAPGPTLVPGTTTSEKGVTH
jgi:formylglycine-generating enzyme required for sulfatase activity